METRITLLIRFVKMCSEQQHPNSGCELYFYAFFLSLSYIIITNTQQ